MSLLQQVALTPDLFLDTGFSDAGLCDMCLGILNPVLLNETIVRDFRNGAWSRQFRNRSAPWNLSGQKLLKALKEQNRLVPAAAELAEEPNDALEWAWEAQASHQKSKLAAIISGRQIYEEINSSAVHCCAEALHESPWWNCRRCSVRLSRSTADYLQHLDLILRCSTSLMFIDPHLDPQRPGYAEFHRILEVAKRQQIPPKVELHRTCYDGSGPNRSLLKSLREAEQRFAGLSNKLLHANLGADVFVWDDFHDRHLISNLIGLNLSNGFDVSTDKDAKTTWSRLSSDDRDDVQREFDPACKRHELRFRFSIGRERAA